MTKEYQVTLKCADNKYKPVSCIVKCEEVNLTNKSEKIKVIKLGTQKICNKRYWTGADLKKYNYTKALVREYDKAEIEKAAAAQYEALKEAKYNSGEWQRPKSKQD